MNWCEDTEAGLAPAAQHPAATVGTMIASQVSRRVGEGDMPCVHASLLELSDAEARADVAVLAHPSCDGEAGLTLPATLIPGTYPVAPAVAFTLTGRTTGRSSRGATVKARAGDGHGFKLSSASMIPVICGCVTISSVLRGRRFG
jgi:hypothetical protein